MQLKKKNLILVCQLPLKWQIYLKQLLKTYLVFLINYFSIFITNSFLFFFVKDFFKSTKSFSFIYFLKNEIVDSYKFGINDFTSKVIHQFSKIMIANLYISEVSLNFLFFKRVIEIIEQLSSSVITYFNPLLLKKVMNKNIKVYINSVIITERLSYIIFAFCIVFSFFILNYLISFQILYLYDINFLFSNILIFMIIFSLISRWSANRMSVLNHNNFIIEDKVSYILLTLHIIFYFLCFFVFKFPIIFFPMVSLFFLCISMFYFKKDLYLYLNNFLLHELTSFFLPLLLIFLTLMFFNFN